MQTRSIAWPAILVSFTLVIAITQAQAVMTGSNMYVDYNEEADVPYSGFVGQYFLDTILIHSPWYGPFFKNFQSPITDTFDPILLDAQAWMPQVVTESYYLPPILSPILTLPVAGWHEQIVTDGWQWVIPGDPRFPDLFPENQSLITLDGKPHPWTIPPMPAVYQPETIWVEFPPIGEGFTLGIHKALLWVGTPGNRIWGDNVTDDGTYLDETSIRVFEHPTANQAGDLPGDLNGDGFVGYDDLDLVLNNWNLAVPRANPLADLAAPDGHYPDGYVGLNDLDVILAHWNTGDLPAEATTVIPEPATLALLSLGISAMGRPKHW